MWIGNDQQGTAKESNEQGWKNNILQVKHSKHRFAITLGSLSNDNGDSNENVTNLHI